MAFLERSQDDWTIHGMPYGAMVNLLMLYFVFTSSPSLADFSFFLFFFCRIALPIKQWHKSLDSVGIEAKKTDSSVCVCVQLLQSSLTLCDPMDHGPPGCSVHGILQARVLEWAVMPFSRPQDQTRLSCTAGRFFTI